MSEIIGLVRQINEITKRESSVVHAMGGLPGAERPQFWHEPFLPLAAQEHALREKANDRRPGKGNHVLNPIAPSKLLLVIYVPASRPNAFRRLDATAVIDITSK
jgi:hypothetical protein